MSVGSSVARAFLGIFDGWSKVFFEKIFQGISFYVMPVTFSIKSAVIKSNTSLPSVVDCEERLT
jgi:hypothetical protein